MIRLLGYFFGIGVMLALGLAAGIFVYFSKMSKDLPDYEVLANYEPPVTSRIHASDGELMGEFARERRLYLPIQAIPDRVKAAFLSAEDKNFYKHGGVDMIGIARAVIVRLQGGPMQGASTITQQVAKNFLLTNEQTYERKVKEAILARRIESAYSKDRILELYLNEIFFGMNSYGIAGAALTYYNKSVNELTIAESAYLASLPKGPANYQPFRFPERAIERRNWVIGQMQENGYITKDEATKAIAEPLGVNVRRSGSYLFASEYFTEEVRRELRDRYGEQALYEGGLSVRTTIDPRMQVIARKAMQRGFIRFDTLRGYRGPKTQIDANGDWGIPLGAIKALDDVPEWKLAVVLESSAQGLRVGLQPGRLTNGDLSTDREEGSVATEDMKWALRHTVDGKIVKAKSPAGVLNPGDVIFVEKKGDSGSAYILRQPPAVSGGLVAMDPHTGRVLAMVGGFSFSESEFNRATQAMRQPGSSFKPIVYAAALDNGYTPASVVMDGPITIQSGGVAWTPKNYDGGSAGPQTLRSGIEKSRNLMTVRLANDMGMKTVAEYAERFGVYDKMAPLISMSLGSGETTVMRMVSAYSVMANGGRQIKPSLIDRIQDRYGKTVFRHDERGCEGCAVTDWNNQKEPSLVDTAEQVLDPMTAYQITSMMEGVIIRGTAGILKELKRPIAGKTGTTNDEKDAWFVGYTPNLVVGLYLGYDQPKQLGKGTTGGGLAAPIFKEFMGEALAGTKAIDFQVPAGMKLVSINRRTGMQAAKGAPDTIIEAFKPGTGPADSYWVIGAEVAENKAPAVEQQKKISPRAQKVIEEGSAGGLY